MNDQFDRLLELARLWGIEPSYDDIFGHHHTSPPEAIIAVLRSLGAAVHRWEDIPAAIQARRESLTSRVLPPVVVVWDEDAVTVPLQRPAGGGGGPLVCTLTFDASASSNPRRWVIDSSDVVKLPGNLAPGYHTLRVEAGSEEWKAVVIAAPRTAFSVSSQGGTPEWGVFLPLFASWSNRSWGAGDFGDLAQLLRFTSARGGRFVGTLPMLACNFTPGETPSPYSPISRLFWNEFYLDVDAIPELKSCVAAQTITASSGFQDEIVAVRRAPKCEYSRIMSLKRRVLELLAKGLFSNPSKRRAAFETYLARHPRLRDFAAFRAAAEQHGPNWRRWPAAPREGTLSAGDFDPDVQRYHMYVQWIAHEQMSALSQNSAGLYLDLPLGVNPDGYDVWRERDSFVPGVAVGAPPDNLFLGGQNWGFPPLHPGVSREHAHHHLKAVLRHHMHHAKMLRIDHVMGLHRLYWVPDGMAATDGVYVNQAHDELYAILCLESQRHGTVIVGEDLGTVPGFVRESMDTHGLHRMYIAQFDLRADSNHAIGPVVPGSVASLNTHDTPTFAGFCSGRDIDDLVDLGLIDPAGAPGMHAHRAAQVRAAEIFLHARGLIAAPGDRAALVRGLIQFLADSEAMTVLVNLEDLWLEPVPHNVPGTVNERPNWRRKTRISLDEMEASPAVLEPLKQMGLALKGQ